ncbi:apolipoprotein N-acyltransferase [Entomospira entomophila]|uniref:Apolipoprotein N-acyltransferase n=1 Tax=Entomospira entomophila TaxID=2719988 RepID=A0A968G809_9SPIO|nr:apolipoprotein N-acyltransferase [Entomospira entomophilus]NIZ40287.1 apolipoprotein N-acyltransferase [Entomospira entomophilus]WDI35846.1 apolipoprotein N-acyltransferase [Entomospira entomophilus]
MRIFILHSLYAIASGIMLSLILPSDLASNGVTLLAFVAIAPLLIATYRSCSYREILWISLLHGWTHAWVGRYWLAFFQNFGFTILIALSIGLSAVTFLALIAVKKTEYLPARHRVWAVTWIWVAFEYLRSTGFLADPWALLAYGFGQSQYMIQIIDMTGPMGLSFVAGLSNAIIAQRLTDPVKNDYRYLRWPIQIFAMTMILSSIYGAFRIHQSKKVLDRHTETAHILLVQQNLDSWDVSWPDLVDEHIRAVHGILPIEQPFDMIVSSETTLLGDFDSIMSMAHVLPTSYPLAKFIREMNTYHLFGSLSVDQEKYSYYNAAFLLNRTGEIAGKPYFKQQLVPFAEALPFSWIPAIAEKYRVFLGMPLLQQSGRESVLLNLPLQSGNSLTFGVPICFEDAFPRVSRKFVRQGAQALLNITNDSWSQRLSSQMQHMMIARYRAIETRRPLLRATNSGMTVHINPWGHIEQMIPAFQNSAMIVDLPVLETSEHTIYVLVGEWFSYIAILMALIYLLGNYNQSLSSLLSKVGKNSFRRASSSE